MCITIFATLRIDNYEDSIQLWQAKHMCIARVEFSMCITHIKKYDVMESKNIKKIMPLELKCRLASLADNVKLQKVKVFVQN